MGRPHAGRSTCPPEEWLLDNDYLMEELISLARVYLPKSYSRILPNLRTATGPTGRRRPGLGRERRPQRNRKDTKDDPHVDESTTEAATSAEAPAFPKEPASLRFELRKLL
jgi:hypothetical protein